MIENVQQHKSYIEKVDQLPPYWWVKYYTWDRPASYEKLSVAQKESRARLFLLGFNSVLTPKKSFRDLLPLCEARGDSFSPAEIVMIRKLALQYKRDVLSQKPEYPVPHSERFQVKTEKTFKDRIIGRIYGEGQKRIRTA